LSNREIGPVRSFPNGADLPKIRGASGLSAGMAQRGAYGAVLEHPNVGSAAMIHVGRTEHDERFSPEPVESRWKLNAVAVLLIVAGGSVFALPLFASLVVETVVGWAFLIAGIFQLLRVWGAKKWRRFAWQVAIAALLMIGGFTLLTNPAAGLISLKLMIIAIFLASAVLMILVGLRLRPSEGWIWFVLLGHLSLATGGLIWHLLPSSAAWSLGLLIGVDLLSAGVVLLHFGSLTGRPSHTVCAAS
jgi:uncharacterized membrane protein HdeD (DUF308 family)